MTRNQNGTWTHYGAFLVFNAIGFALLAYHWFTCLSRELGEQGEHDHFSGDSWILPLARRLKVIQKDKRELVTQVGIEPGLTFLFGLFLQFSSRKAFLGKWLMLAAVCLATKEGINYWNEIRKRKRSKDALDDARDSMTDSAPGMLQSALRRVSGAIHGPTEKRPASQEPEIAQKEWRAARLLGMEPPYSLDKATECYRARVKASHPDSGDSEAEGDDLDELKEALEVFRAKFGELDKK